MKIVSWNIYKKNKNLTNLKKGLLDLNAEIFCLQEVPESFLDELSSLKEHGYDLFVCDEFDCKMVVLSRLNVQKHSTVCHEGVVNSYENIRKSLERRYESKLETQFVDVVFGEKKLRIFNTHLPLRVPPKVRMSYLDSIFNNFSSNHENIICGDFNPVGKFPFNMLWGWAYNYSLKDYLHHEPHILRKKIKSVGLNNLFRFRCTHPITRQQLDYILTPKTLKIANKKVQRKRYRSDHRPLLVEIK